MRKITPIVLLIILCSSCVTKLKVTVKSADREVVLKEAEKYIKEDVERGIATLENFYYNWDDNTILERIYDYIPKEDTATFPEESKVAFKNQFENRLQPKLDSIKKLATEAQNLYDTNKNYEALSKVNFAGKIVFEIQDILKNYEIKNQKVELVFETITQTSKAISGTVRTKFPILGDPMVSFLTKKENDTIWKSCYNKTVSSNFFGNADIAFILRGNPPENEIKSGDYNNNFTIKGVRLDANDASNALLTGLTQTLNFVANTQGLPLNIGQKQDPNYPAPVENALVTSLANDKNTLENKKRKLADYKKMLVEKILSEKIDEKRGADLTAAIQRIETFWNTLKTELNK
ncbi:hypothetical protein [Flavobacterium sp. U410]